MRFLPFLLLFPTLAFADSATLQVKGMHCTACALKVEAALLENPAVESAKVDVQAGRVEVQGAPDADLDEATLSSIVTSTGYQVVGVEVRD